MAGTAVAAAAMAALSASQAPGFLPVAHAAADQPKDAEVEAPPGPAIDGGSPYITDMPPLNTPTGPPLVTPTSPTPGSPSISVPAGAAGLPATVLAAYQRAAASVAQSNPGCHLPWQLLAAIGQVESGQARRGAVDANGTTYRPILGPVLNGNGFASIGDTDGGRYDGDPVYDRAVGPMQFIPSTWEHWGADGNGDGTADPNNVFDAALAAAHYLCADGRDLAVPADMDRAILGYNHSQAYLALVRAWYEHFVRGAVAVPDRPGTPAAPGTPGASGTPSAPGSPTGTASTPPTAPGSGSTTPPTKPPASSSGSATTDPTQGASTPPTGGTTTAPPSDPSTPPSSDPTDPTTPPTSPGCETPTPSDSPSDTASPSPSGSATDDPCATDSPTPDPTDSGSATASAEASASTESTPAS